MLSVVCVFLCDQGEGVCDQSRPVQTCSLGYPLALSPAHMETPLPTWTPSSPPIKFSNFHSGPVQTCSFGVVSSCLRLKGFIF